LKTFVVWKPLNSSLHGQRRSDDNQGCWLFRGISRRWGAIGKTGLSWPVLLSVKKSLKGVLTQDLHEAADRRVWTAAAAVLADWEQNE